MDDFDAQVIRTALKEMFEPSGHFSIVALRRCLNVARVVPPMQELRRLEALHCVSWSDMEPDFRNEVIRRTLALFEHPTMGVDLLPEEGDPQEDTPPRPFFKRLMQGSARG